MPNAKCQSIRDAIKATEEGIREAEGILPELLGPVKASIQNFIKQERVHLKQLRNALKACEAS